MNKKLILGLILITILLLLTGCSKYNLGDNRELVHSSVCKEKGLVYTRQPNLMNGVNFHNFYCLDNDQLKEFYIDNYEDYEILPNHEVRKR